MDHIENKSDGRHAQVFALLRQTPSREKRPKKTSAIAERYLDTPTQERLLNRALTSFQAPVPPKGTKPRSGYSTSLFSKKS